jgi:hypothetical protein
MNCNSHFDDSSDLALSYSLASEFAFQQYPMGENLVNAKQLSVAEMNLW